MTDSLLLDPEIEDDDQEADLGDLLLEVLPGDGTTIGNLSAREALSRVAERQISEEEYESVKERALALGMIRKGRGRGGAIGLEEGIPGGSRYEAPIVTSEKKKNKQGKKKGEANKNYKEVLWDAAEELRNQMDAAEYKHLVLGLIFIKYISDTFSFHYEKLRKTVSDPTSEYYAGEDPLDQQAMLDDRDFFLGEGIFWVPETARWEHIRSKAKQSNIGEVIDRALIALENENDSLKGKMDRRFGRSEQQMEPGTMGMLVDLISKIGFQQEDRAKDILGDVYEYFLGKFAKAEGKQAGSFYTPGHVVKVLVEILAPHHGRVYDPCCGSGGMFVQSESFIRSHGGNRDDISIYGQESSFTTWRLAAMNLAIRGVSANLGETNADTFGRDQFPDQKFDFILANPPFNVKKWNGEKYDVNPRWKYGRPPITNANYAWLQHILWKLRPGGSAGVVLANGAMSSMKGEEGEIRKAMIQDDVVEVMVALPAQLFLNTPVAVCLWFLANDKTHGGRDRRGETLFIYARHMGTMDTRANRVLTNEDIAKISNTVHAWRGANGSSGDYQDVDGFCYGATLEDIEKHNFILAPGRYVGAADEDDEDEEEFGQKMQRLIVQLVQNNEEAARLDQQIARNLGSLGYEF